MKQFTLKESTHVSAPQAAGLHTLGDEETSQHNLLGVPGDVVNQQGLHLAHQAASAPGSAFEQGAVSVSGGNMGQVSGPRSRVKKIKKKTPDTSMLIASDKGAEQKLLQQEEARLEGIAEKLEKLIHAKKNAIEPKQSFTLRGYRFLRWVLSFGLSPEERDVRIPGHVRYNEIILTFLYWNKERNIVPQKMVEKRKKFDEVIQFEVAIQLIRAVCLGGIVRRRIRVQRMEARNKLKGAQSMVLGGRSMIYRGSKLSEDKVRRKQVAATQDLNAQNNLWLFSDSPDTGPLKQTCCTIAKCGLASGSELADEAEDAGFEVADDGIFELDDQQIRSVLHASAKLKLLFEHVMKIDEVKLLLQEVSLLAPAYLHLAAKKHGIAFGDHFQHLQSIPHDTLRDILEEPYVVSIIPAAVRRKSLWSAPEDQDNYAAFDEDHLPSFAEENSRTKALDQEAAEVQILMQKELESLREEYKKHAGHSVEVNDVLSKTQEKVTAMESNIQQMRKNNSRMAMAAIKSSVKVVNSARLGSANKIVPRVTKSHSEVYTLSEGDSEEEPELLPGFDAPGQLRTSWSSAGNISNFSTEVEYDSVEVFDARRDRSHEQDTGERIAMYDGSCATSALRPDTAPVLRPGTDEPLHLPGQFEGSWVESGMEGSHSDRKKGQTVAQERNVPAMVDRPFTAPPVHSKLDDDPESLETSLQIAKAEIERMERLYTSVVRQQGEEKKARRERLLAGQTEQERETAASSAAARREQKENALIADSESTSTCLLSPRDKPTRKLLAEREANKKQRKVESRGSSRQASQPAKAASQIDVCVCVCVF